MINASVYVEVMKSERLGIVCTISDTHSNVEDVHNDLEVMVYNENKSGKSELIGKIRVPLLRVGYPLHTFSLLLTLSLLSFLSLLLSFLSPLPLSLPHPLPLLHTQLESGVTRMYVLKDKHLLQSAKGVVFLECELVYNPVRACIRTINPRESKLLEEEQKFKRKVSFPLVLPGLGGEEYVGHLGGLVRAASQSPSVFYICLLYLPSSHPALHPGCSCITKNLLCLVTQ